MANVELVGKGGRVVVQEPAINRYLSKGAVFLHKEDEEAYVARKREGQKAKESVNEVKKDENAKAETKKIEKREKKTEARKKKKAVGTDKEQG